MYDIVDFSKNVCHYVRILSEQFCLGTHLYRINVRQTCLLNILVVSQMFDWTFVKCLFNVNSALARNTWDLQYYFYYRITLYSYFFRFFRYRESVFHQLIDRWIKNKMLEKGYFWICEPSHGYVKFTCKAITNSIIF